MELLTQAVLFLPPGAGSTVALTDASSTAEDVSAYEGGWMVLLTDTECHIRFGASDVGAAVTTDFLLPADTEFRYYIPKSGEKSYFRAILASGTGTLYYAEA
jgi:hypothetical protein